MLLLLRQLLQAPAVIAPEVIAPVAPGGASSDTGAVVNTLPFGGSGSRYGPGHHYYGEERIVAVPDHEEEDEEQVIAALLMQLDELELV